MIHELKTWTRFWRSIATGKKPFEVRLNDRNFTVGDTLDLREFDPCGEEYTGNRLTAKVTYVLIGGEFGIKENYCVMGISLTDTPNGKVTTEQVKDNSQ